MFTIAFCTGPNPPMNIDQSLMITTPVITDIEVRYPKFHGNGYLALPVLKTGYKEFDVTIDFKPRANNGLLLYSAESGEAKVDFFSIVLLNGYVEFRYAI